MKKIELLAPAGNLEKCKIAILYGADAVYIGGKNFSLRARASNFSYEDIKEACRFAHNHGAKIYVTMNIVPHHEDFVQLEPYLLFLEEAGVNAIICSSVYLIDLAKKITHRMEVHLSTQLSIANSEACNSFYNKGIERIVLARELSLDQISQIRKRTAVGLEVFIHGGMCSSLSGRCVLSNHMVNRDANRGGCAHSCRWNYRLKDEQDKEVLPGRMLNMGSKDLMALHAVPVLMDIGIDSLKIEGRMKSDYYLATVIKCYRELIDTYAAGKEINYQRLEEEIAKAENRETATGFLFHEVGIEEQVYGSDSHPTKEFVGMVLDYDEQTKLTRIEQRNYFKPGDKLEFFGPQLPNTQWIVDCIWDEERNILDAARHPKQKILLKLPFRVQPKDMIRLVLK